MIRKQKINPVIRYLLVDIICAAAGMGVPIFCILLGFPLGWLLTKRIILPTADLAPSLRKLLKLSLLSSGFTFLLMLLIWGSAILLLFDNSSDFQNFGHPMILFDPKLSFIGWLILMIIISPFLQLLTTIFASFITLLTRLD